MHNNSTDTGEPSVLTWADRSDLYDAVLAPRLLRSAHGQIHGAAPPSAHRARRHTREHRSRGGRYPQRLTLPVTHAILVTAWVRCAARVGVHTVLGLHVPGERLVLLTLVVAHGALDGVLHLVQVKVLRFLSVTSNKLKHRILSLKLTSFPIKNLTSNSCALCEIRYFLKKSSFG